MNFPDSIEEAVKAFSMIQGIGEKTAFRYVNSIIKWDNLERVDFAKRIQDLNNLKFCNRCGFFAEEIYCQICLTEHRKIEKKMCVIESISDLMAIERSNQFHGTYFVLNGVLNPLLGVGPDEIKIPKLLEVVKKEEIESLILAVNPSVEGDATCSYIKMKLASHNIVIERIGFGIPMGGNLEYLDSLTISRALENRKSF